MERDSQPEAYCVHAWIRGVHPMLWRRFLIRSDSTLADLHVVLQIGFDWTDFHLHRFRIRKKDYAVPRLGGLACHDARKIKLADLHFRINERFLYEYDCGGPHAFLDRRASAPWRVRELLDDLLEGVKARDTEALDYRLEELQPWQEWLVLHRFDRRRVNRRLRQYAEGALESMKSRGEWQR